MRIDIGPKFVAAEKHVTAEERVAFALEIQILRQPDDFVTVLLHPAREVRRFARPFLVPEITRDETASDSETGVGGEDHVGKFRPRRDQLDLAIQVRELFEETFPLRLNEGRIGATRPAHPRIDLVLDAVIVRRTEEKLAHVGNQLARERDGQLAQEWLEVGDET